MADATLKSVLIEKGLPEKEAAKFALYVNNAKAEESRKDEGKAKPVTANTSEMLIALAVKFWNMDILIDGVNAIISGKNMAMVTFNGYKNKVLKTYPETQFDIQLVREGDTFNFSKKDGHVHYDHQIGDPFSQNNKPIIGAYVVFKNKRGEFLEMLNKKDFDEMKKASKQSYLWGTWESEFWLKSVIKRACKRHFYDVIAEIDKNDNDDYGLVADDAPKPKPDESAKVKKTILAIGNAETLDAARKIFIDSGLMANKEVVDAYNAAKEMLTDAEGNETPPDDIDQTPPEDKTDEGGEDEK